jgi:hypothetical protein
LIEHNRIIRILNPDILIRDIVNISIPNIRAGPSLQARAVLPIEQCDVLDVRVGDVVLDAGVLADGAHGNAVRAVAPQVLNEDVGRVGFRGEAVVADVDARVGHGEAVDVEGVEAVGVFG